MRLNFIQRVNLVLYCAIVAAMLLFFLPMSSPTGFIGCYGITQRIGVKSLPAVGMTDEEIIQWQQSRRKLTIYESVLFEEWRRQQRPINVHIDFVRSSIMIAAITFFFTMIHIAFSGEIKPKTPAQS